MGSLMTIIVLAIYKHVMDVKGETSKVDGGMFVVFYAKCWLLTSFSNALFFLVWRIVVGLSLIPAFGTLYQRLTLPESTRYIEAKKLQITGEPSEEKKDSIVEVTKDVESASADRTSPEDNVEDVVKKKAHFSGQCLFH